MSQMKTTAHHGSSHENRGNPQSSPLLRGVRVIERSAFIAAPLCGLTLAEHGAEVIRIDRIGGGIDYGRLPVKAGGRSIYWTSLNKGKKSISVDTTAPQGRELVRELITAAGMDGGVLLTNLPAPWLDSDSLRAKRHDLITCTIEGNADGSTALDYTVNCATGYPYATGEATRDKPVNHSLPAWDVACAYQASFGLAAAVADRRASGRGSDLRLALSDVAFATLSHLGILTEVSLGLPDRDPIGNDIYGAFGRDFRTADGRRLMVAAISARQWRSLVEAADLGASVAEYEAANYVDLGKESDRFRHRDAIAALLAPWIGHRPLGVVAAIFDQFGVCWGRYQAASELVRDDPRVVGQELIYKEIETAGVGRHIAAGAMIRRDGSAAKAPEPAPILGQHTDEVLSEVLGLSSDSIGRLHDQGVVAGPDRDPLFPVSAVSRPSHCAAGRTA